MNVANFDFASHDQLAELEDQLLATLSLNVILDVILQLLEILGNLSC